MTDGLSTAQVLEILATSGNLLYVLLLIREKIACWAFGIVGSVISVWLFVDAQLYSESLLYLFYAALGIWGWLHWHSRTQRDNNPVVRWRPATHLLAILAASLLALILGQLMHCCTQAERPLFDAFTTVFSFLGTYLQISKVLESWLYWLIINVASMWLYQDRGLDIYAALMGIYSILSVYGLLSWRKSWLIRQRTT
ncbi:MAG: nicotinamide mononucleotide transporter [Halioglobus sp.]|nr:nicotinamide mononucleotide transporter [Halioglobus sp.]